MPALRQGRGASIVNIASDALWLGRPGYLHYVAGKAGVYGMTHSMSHELGPDGIRVNTISPGPVFTEVARETVTQQQKDAMLAAQAIKRPVRAVWDYLARSLPAAVPAESQGGRS
ncbi:MAG: SDR family NAD(P)-dependent oxidoreductase [Streptosporangiaceae bacterium]